MIHASRATRLASGLIAAGFLSAAVLLGSFYSVVQGAVGRAADTHVATTVASRS